MKCCDCGWERISNGCGCVWPCKQDETGVWVKISCEVKEY